MTKYVLVKMSYNILKNNSKTKVCVLEKDSRFGGRILDHRFKEAPNIIVGKADFCL